MSTPVAIAIYLNVTDEAAFRQAARDRAISDGLSGNDADGYLDEDKMSLERCAVMLLDPGQSPDGSEILDSGGL